MSFAVVIDRDFYWLYFFFPAGAIPFSVGAILYFALQNQKIRVLFQHKSVLIIALTLYCIPYCFAAISPGIIKIVLLYLNIITSALLIACLYIIKPRPGARKVDAFLGDLSFPIYIFHLQAGLLATYFLDLEKGNSVVFLASLPLLFIFSILDRACVSGPIAKLRRK